MAKAKSPSSGDKAKAKPGDGDKAPEKESGTGAKPAEAAPDAKASAKPPADAEAKPAETAKEPAKDAVKDVPKPAAAAGPDAKKTEEPAAAKKADAGDGRAKDDKAKPADAAGATKTETPPKPKPTARPAPTPPPPAPPARRGGFVPLVLGGVIAAGLGYFASEAGLISQRAGTDALQAEVAAQAEGFDARLAALEGAEAPAVDVSGLEESIAALSAQASDLADRIAQLEARPIVVAEDGNEAAEAYAAELAALTSTVQSQQAEIAALIENAQSVEEATADAAARAAVQTAMAQVTAALTSGEPFAAALSQLDGVFDVPEALSASAADGVATLADLQGRYADAARAALAAARAGGDAEGGQSLGAFLRGQLGARSVTPREGDDPDAVLSRAEQAVREGRLGAALTEIDALPAAAQDALGAWWADAQTRAAAEDAVNELTSRTAAN